jgi:hypothetical protein
MFVQVVKDASQRKMIDIHNFTARCEPGVYDERYDVRDEILRRQ